MFKKKSIVKWSLRSLLTLFLLILISRFLIPTPTFEKPTSTIIEAADGTLLSARIAADGQWRFPAITQVPNRFETCILLFEDRHFYSHPGINPVSFFRALRKNIEEGRVVQGGSTLSMQVARIWGDGESRTYLNKIKEILIAFHLEVNLSKEEILKMYCSNAPFGGNVVGLETASWRYYGRAPSELSWSECATLAVLPNAPSLIYPGKGHQLLMKKRNGLLKELLNNGYLTIEEYELAIIEQLPSKPEPLPSYATHLLDRMALSQKGERIRTTIYSRLQSEAQRLLNEHIKSLESIDVHNGAVIICNSNTQEILAYIGNANFTMEHANAVDCASAARSSGSILKPLIHSAMIQSGELTPTQLVIDIPTQFGEYVPENYHSDHDGVVPANEALRRSLNIPYVRLLKSYGVGRFYDDLNELGLTTINRPANHYGLSLMLGGAEVRLDELTNLYSRMGAELNGNESATPFDDWSIHHTFEALTHLTRPEGREYQRSFSSERKVAWKTGTSYGFKDAWAIGVTPDYTIGVWIGNADGEGRTGLSGVSCAAPLMFDLLDRLPAGSWFDIPMDGAQLYELCAKSGHIKGLFCEEVKAIELPSKEYSAVGLCPYHKRVYVTEDNRHRGLLNCAPYNSLKEKEWFSLPPAQEYYYEKKHADYRSLPPLLESCTTTETPMEFVYPRSGQSVYIPTELQGGKGRMIATLAHRQSDATLHWYLDTDYLGSTSRINQMPVYCTKGKHLLYVVDESGNDIAVEFYTRSEGDVHSEH